MRNIGLVAAFFLVYSSACQQAQNDDVPSQEPIEKATDDDSIAYVEQAEEAIRFLQAGLVEA